MRLVAGSLAGAGSVAVLPGSFHPPTLAHLSLALAARNHADRVVLVLPASFPHKSYEDVPLHARLEILARLCVEYPNLAAAQSTGGLFLEMASELRSLHPAVERVLMVCGRDAADRIVNWPYPPGQSIQSQFSEYDLLVAARDGDYEPPPGLGSRIHSLDFTPMEISATAVRQAIASGRRWRHMVPPPIHALVEKFYAPP